MNKIYKTAIYLRLSREDYEKDKESNSISNQRGIIIDYIDNQDDLEFFVEYIDDGLSGFDFDRPNFEKMINDAREEKFDCIIVKDLSRLGRNFQKSEEFMQRNFPKLGIRFIAVLNGFDSEKELSTTERLAIPVTNLLNEYHVLETSRKVRNTFDNLRKSGKFFGNKIAFGYAIKNKQIEIDDTAAEVVRKIFSLKISGMSNQAIGDLLNKNGNLCPMEHKLSNDIPIHRIDWRKGEKATWSSQSVNRILRDRIYVGTMIQGKTMSQSYRDKKRVLKDPSEWTVFENYHEPIISETVFQIVADLLSKDSYSTNKESYTFSGFAFCGNCGKSLYHRTANGGKQTYWQCMNRECQSKRNINEKSLSEAVFQTLKAHISIVLDYSEPITVDKVEYISNQQEDDILENIERMINARDKMSIQMSEQMISKSELEEMNLFYNSKIKKLEVEKEEVIKTKIKLADCINDITAQFKKYAEMKELTREFVVTFIEKIIVENKNSINIFFRYSNFFTEINDKNELPCNLLESEGKKNGA